MRRRATATARQKYEGKYLDLYVGDVFTKDRLSINLGVRWDQQKAKNHASHVPANASFPDRLPGLTTPATPTT